MLRSQRCVFDGRPPPLLTLSPSAITSKNTIRSTGSPPWRKMYAGIQSLKQWPQRDRVGREEGTRELLFSPLPYVAVYRRKEQAFEVLRIYHALPGETESVY
jgi:hypothetical protein